MQSEKRAGLGLSYFCVAAATLLWAASANFAKAAFAGRLGGLFPHLQRIDVLMLTQMRVTVSTVLLTIFLLSRGGWRAVRLPWRLVVPALITGALGVAGSNFFYYYAVDRTTVATAIVVQYTAPVYVMLYRVLAGEEQATARRASAVVCAVIGCALTIGVGSAAHLRIDTLGVLAAQGAAFTYSFYNVMGGVLAKRIPNLLLMFYTVLGATLLWLPIHPPQTWVAYSSQQWLFLICFAVMSMLVPYILYFRALTRLDSTSAIVTSCLEPVFAVMLAAMFLGETKSPLEMVGIVLVIGSVLALAMDKHRKSAAAELPVAVE